MLSNCAPQRTPDLGADGYFVSPADTSPETINDAGTRMDTGFRHDSAQLGTMGHETGDGARCRVRTGRTPAQHQALVKDYSPHCSPASGTGVWAEFSEVAGSWAGLPEPLRAAILAIVRSSHPADTLALERRNGSARNPNGSEGK
jgi:hypothetical protein